VERIGRWRLGFGRVDLQVVVHPESPVMTDLTDADPLLGFGRVNILVYSLVPVCAAISSLQHYGAWEVGYLELGFPSSVRSDR
jgi:hypothetical protein